MTPSKTNGSACERRTDAEFQPRGILYEKKTSLRDARSESFDFLGYTFGPHRYRKAGHRYLSASASKKSVQRIKTKVGEILIPGEKGPWPKVRDKLNRLLLGWSAHFGHGTHLPAYRAVDQHVYDRVRHFLARRHKVQGRGARRFPHADVFGELGVLHLRRVPLDRRRVPYGEAGRKAECGSSARPVYGRGRETGRCRMAQATAPFLDSTTGHGLRRLRPASCAPQPITLR